MSTVTGSTLAGHACAYCGTWLSGTEAYWCERMHPNWSPSWEVAMRIDYAAPGGVYERIAIALEWIAEALESNTDSESKEE